LRNVKWGLSDYIDFESITLYTTVDKFYNYLMISNDQYAQWLATFDKCCLQLNSVLHSLMNDQTTAVHVTVWRTARWDGKDGLVDSRVKCAGYILDNGVSLSLAEKISRCDSISKPERGQNSMAFVHIDNPLAHSRICLYVYI